MNDAMLCLVCHDAITAPAERFYVGQTDASLSGEGIEEARALQSWLGTVGFDWVSSDLKRVQRTAEIIAVVLLVAHAGVNRLIFCDALGIPVAELHCIGQESGSLSIKFSETGTRLKLLNFTPPPELKTAEFAMARHLPMMQAREVG